MISELTNKEISKQLFLSTMREEILSYFPNRVFKVVDTSDTRYSGSNPHLPIMFVEVNPKGENSHNIQYTFLVNIDRMGTNDMITPNIFVGALSWQLDNLDTITKNLVEKFSS
jgi:hypothetical protein